MKANDSNPKSVVVPQALYQALEEFLNLDWVKKMKMKSVDEIVSYAIWDFLKKLSLKGKIYRGTDVVPWSGRSGTSYSQMEIIEGRKLVAHKSVFVKFPLKDHENEYVLVWTTTPWTLTSNVCLAVNKDLDYLKCKLSNGEIYYLYYRMI